MKKLFFGICLTLLQSGHVLAQDENAVEIEVLAKTSSSWDGETLPDYTNGTTEKMRAMNPRRLSFFMLAYEAHQ